MRQTRIILSLTTAWIAASAVPAAAQDAVAPYMKLDKLTRAQRAAIESEVAQRVRRLPDAGTDIDKREGARSRITRTATIEGATPAALEAYAEICSGELKPLLDHDVFETASDAALVLLALDHPATSNALADGLQSRHSGVRIMCARALHRLHPKLASDADRCRAALRALGRAGARESDEHVLRVIYGAIDFKGSVRTFKQGAQSADAVADVLAARVAQLAAGSRDELKDEAALEVVARCFGDAEKGTRARLLDAVAGLLGHALIRYFDEDTAPEYLATLSRLIVQMDQVLRDAAKTAGVTVSCDPLKLDPKAKNLQAQRTAAEKVMNCLLTAFPNAYRFL